TYALWLEKVRSDLDIANTLPGKAAAYTYFYLREDDMKIIGMVNIRLELTDFLRKEGGHIGYSIRPTERGKGYGTKMLREVLKIFGRIGINSIIVTCDKKNIASAGVIKNCGGVLDSEFYSKTYGEVLQRYSIAVCSEK
ncbi:MAG: GNAT family N-acetyltransferase, partial [Clostridiales bacterium]|nr:GNAT family N-acetyltransferase [Clostridiales bacterium]